MKKYCLFIALAMVAGMTVSCKNNKKAEADAEVVEVTKTILADDVLATIDELAKTYSNESNNFDVPEFITSYLSEEEKMIRPDYLLDPAKTSELITKSQKVAALAILCSEKPIRSAYGMPVEDSEEAIARLVAELNHPLSVDELKDLKPSEGIRRFYESSKESGELAYFWQLNSAFMTEFLFLIVNNPEPVLNNLTDEQWSLFKERYESCLQAVRVLAEYDEEIASVLSIMNETNSVSNDEEASVAFATKESGIQKILEAKDKYIARRNALLELIEG